MRAYDGIPNKNKVVLMMRLVELYLSTIFRVISLKKTNKLKQELRKKVKIII